MEPNAFLRQIHGLIVAFRKEKSIAIGKFATDAGLKKNALGSIEEEKMTDKGRVSTVDLWSLVKIMIRYPELKDRIGNHLRTNTDKNLTRDVKDNNSPNDQHLSQAELLDLYRHSYYNVKADLDEKNKRISEQDARILDLENQLNEERKKKVSKSSG